MEWSTVPANWMIPGHCTIPGSLVIVWRFTLSCLPKKTFLEVKKSSIGLFRTRLSIVQCQQLIATMTWYYGGCLELKDNTRATSFSFWSGSVHFTMIILQIWVHNEETSLRLSCSRNDFFPENEPSNIGIQPYKIQTLLRSFDRSFKKGPDGIYLTDW